MVASSVPVKANSGVTARVPAAGKMLEGDDKPTLLREDQHYLHYITIIFTMDWPPTASCKLIYADDMCLSAQGSDRVSIETILTEE